MISLSLVHTYYFISSISFLFCRILILLRLKLFIVLNFILFFSLLISLLLYILYHFANHPEAGSNTLVRQDAASSILLSLFAIIINGAPVRTEQVATISFDISISY